MDLSFTGVKQEFAGVKLHRSLIFSDAFPNLTRGASYHGPRRGSLSSVGLHSFHPQDFYHRQPFGDQLILMDTGHL